MFTAVVSSSAINWRASQSALPAGKTKVTILVWSPRMVSSSRMISIDVYNYISQNVQVNLSSIFLFCLKQQIKVDSLMPFMLIH
jgi:hypothetical protein